VSIVTFGTSGSGFLVLVHGGAGDVPEASRDAHAAGCKRAVESAVARLRAGATALDAAQAAVVALEDDPRFNAGTGACLTEDGTMELDASIMEGRTLRAGGVAVLPPFRNPIAIARAVLDDGRHVLYSAGGATKFAEARGFVPIRDDSMITADVRARYETLRANRGGAEGFAGGTVGAVVRDASGSFAAATSTGGMFMKRAGRIGDSPIIGAGTYADDAAGACSTTGHGESMMRLCLAKTAIESMRAGMAAEAAAKAAIELMEQRTGATGGMILVDAGGRIGWARNTTTMSWAACAGDWSDPRSGY
jgi:L-asparaginase / beta-aspartyl-peptidase